MTGSIEERREDLRRNIETAEQHAIAFERAMLELKSIGAADETVGTRLDRLVGVCHSQAGMARNAQRDAFFLTALTEVVAAIGRQALNAERRRRSSAR